MSRYGANRFTAPESGEIGVLYRNSTQTYRGALGHDRGRSISMTASFVVRRDSGGGRTKGLNGATVCVAQGDPW
jgi:general L-amino acid transport system substrate-binding protein